ncbi:MAG: PIN domain-containing protein [Armatimonadota bacterium]
MRIRILTWIFSGIFAFGCGLIGYAVANPYVQFFTNPTDPTSREPFRYFEFISPILFVLLGGIVGFIVGSILFHRIAEVGSNLRRIPAEDKIASTFGTLLSLLLVIPIGTLIWRIDLGIEVRIAILLLVTVMVIWLFNVVALSMKDEMKFLVPGMAQRPTQAPIPAEVGATPKLLDTNVIIDGRIYDIARSGFLDGPILLPGFVLEELQRIADSADALRRNRGRRGLDILHQMQTELDTTLRVMDRYKVSFAPGDEVDIKLVKLAKGMSADIVTNDFNLNKVAKLHGVRVLNINELANAVKPVVLPGEELHVTVVREGKEYNQGVGYLDDGTMVVIENGKKMLGDSVTVAVSSVLQTVAGKMIFAELKYENGQEETDEHNGYYSGRGNRRKTQ